MESQRVVVVVEDVAAARAALQWAVRNFIRAGDCITLLHVCPPARSRRRRRSLRLGGFQLALAFKELCNGIAENKERNQTVPISVMHTLLLPIIFLMMPCHPALLPVNHLLKWCLGMQAKVEIVVREGELGETVVATVNQLGATTLVVGLHDKSFLYRSASPYERMRRLGCRVLGIRQHATARHGSFNTELTQIETINLHVPPPKIPFPMFTLPLAMLWRRRSKARKRK